MWTTGASEVCFAISIFDVDNKYEFMCVRLNFEFKLQLNFF